MSRTRTPLHQAPKQHRGRRRIAAAAVLATGLLGMGVPTAFAHTGVLATTAECQVDGTRLVTYTGTTKKVPSSGAGHVATLSVGELLPVGTVASPNPQTVTGNTTFTFTQTIPGDAGSAQATAFLVWGDGAQSDPIGQAAFRDDCSVPDKVHKVFVCKYVGTPGINERLQTGNNPISVDENSTEGAEVGESFNDAQGRSLILAIDDGTTSYSTADCPVVVPEKPEPTVEVTHTDDEDCDSTEVTTTTVTTTTDWVLTDNVWVEATPVVTQEVTTRPATLEECPVVVPEKPEPTVEVTETDYVDCDSTEIVTETIITNTDWVLTDDNEWEESVDVTWDVTTRPATLEECPVVVPEDEPEPEVEVLGVEEVVELAANPLPTAAAAGEANTDALLVAGGFGAFAAFLLMGTGSALRRRRCEV